MNIELYDENDESKRDVFNEDTPRRFSDKRSETRATARLNNSYAYSNGNSTKSFDLPCVESVTQPASGQTITNPLSCP